QLVSPSSPVIGNEYLVAYLTGIGRLTVTPQSGAGSPSSPLAQSADAVTATLGNQPVTVLFAGLTPGFVGLIQVNLQLGALPAGSCAALVFQVAGVTSPAVNLATGSAGCAPAAAPTLSLSASSVAFGTVTIGQTKDLTVNVSNTGTATLAVSALN